MNRLHSGIRNWFFNSTVDLPYVIAFTLKYCILFIVQLRSTAHYMITMNQSRLSLLFVAKIRVHFFLTNITSNLIWLSFQFGHTKITILDQTRLLTSSNHIGNMTYQSLIDSIVSLIGLIIFLKSLFLHLSCFPFFKPRFLNLKAIICSRHPLDFEYEFLLEQLHLVTTH